MIDFKGFEVWFITGSQHLYGEKTLNMVSEHSLEMVQRMNASGKLPIKVVFKPSSPSFAVKRITVRIVSVLLPGCILSRQPGCGLQV
jgi:L-arabinose isomerase